MQAQSAPAPERARLGPQRRPVVFLHIPKTAGQSVHALLERLFGKDAVAPVRVNAQLLSYSVAELARWRVFSGHLDWCRLDCLPEMRFTFAIFRDPLDRLLSFYLFLRRDAARYTPAELEAGNRQGLRAALTMTPDEYFLGQHALRGFLDGAYDNFYAHFLAGRSFDARQQLHSVGPPAERLTESRIVEMALANLDVLDGVYATTRLDQLQADLLALAGATTAPLDLATLHVNAGEEGTREDRMAALRNLGATERTFARLHEMTRLDAIIWQEVERRVAARPASEALPRL